MSVSADRLPRRQPVVLVPACNRMAGEHPFHMAGQKYVDAVRLAGCLPLVVPAARIDEVDHLLSLADGVLLTGSASNVHPSRFGEAVLNPALPLDPVRDDWTLALIPKALALGVPLFGICRGFQEVNVALGGSLHQAVQTVPGHFDHRGADGREGATAAELYAPAHPVQLLAGGLLAELLGPDDVVVNSVHGQGVNRLAPSLRAEALASDGLVEAFTQPGAPAFNLCVQWHPEWQAAGNPVSLALFRAFGRACELHAGRRLAPETAPEPDH